jgi:BirA family biotin operon repressor/biotin-[acetyl-CoA-carboxylase] ligase
MKPYNIPVHDQLANLPFTPSPMTSIKLNELELDLRRRLSPVLDSGVQLTVVGTIESTNAQLKTEAVTSNQTLLLAREQTAGVGRRGSPWQSPPAGNLYLSYCVHSDRPLNELSLWSLGVTVAVANALERELSLECKIKWPNDLYLQGMKVGGVLLETVNLPGDDVAVVIGVGLNIASHPDPTLLQRPVTCISKHTDKSVDLSMAAAVVSVALVDMCRLSHASLQAWLTSSWPSRDLLLNQPVLVPTLGEGLVIARGLSHDGGLQVEFAGKIRTVYAGEVSLGHVDTQ